MKKPTNKNEVKKDEFPMRINKYLAHKNFSTRRGADELIEKKRILINGRIAQLGDKVEEKDVVEVRAGKSGKDKEYVYYAYNKPKGIVTLAPQAGEKDIAGSIDLKNVFPIGRLDKASEGLIILTSDGRITDRLLNPKFDHEKEYIVTTQDKLRSSFKDKMEKGVDIGETVTKPCKIKVIGDNKFRIILSEGKRHQIRRMCSALFAEVKELKRVRIMNVELGKMSPNQYRRIQGDELSTLLKSLNL